MPKPKSKKSLSPEAEQALWSQIQHEAESGRSLSMLAKNYGFTYPKVQGRATREGWATPKIVRDMTESILANPLSDGSYPLPSGNIPFAKVVARNLEQMGERWTEIPLETFAIVIRGGMKRKNQNGELIGSATLRVMEQDSGDTDQGANIEVGDTRIRIHRSNRCSPPLPSDSSARQGNGTSIIETIKPSDSNENAFVCPSKQNAYRNSLDGYLQKTLQFIENTPPLPKTVGEVAKVYELYRGLVGLSAEKGGSGPTVVNVQILNGMRRLSKGKPVRKARGKVVEVIETEETED